MASFPELHSLSQSGKTMTWSIRVFERNNEAVISVTHGYLNGKLQINEKTITSGTNLGKKNYLRPP